MRRAKHAPSTFDAPQLARLRDALGMLDDLGTPPTPSGIAENSGRRTPESRPPPDTIRGGLYRRMLARYLWRVDDLAARIVAEVEGGPKPPREGWRCSCGKFGNRDARFCAYCGQGRLDV